MTAITREEVQNLRAVAVTYRRLILIVAAQWLAAWLANGVATAAGSRGTSPFVLAIALVTACLLAYYGYRLAELLGRGVPALWAIAMFIPLVNLICLLALSRASQTFCSKYNIRVGFIGPSMSEVDRLEQAVVNLPPR